MVLKDDSSSRYHNHPPSAINLESPVRSQSNFSFKSEENNLEREMMQNAMQQPDQEDNNEKDNDEDNESNCSEKKLMVLNTSILATSSPKPGIKVSGTLKLSKPFDLQKPYSSNHKRLLELEEDYRDFEEPGCAPNVLATIWSSLFD